MQQVNNPLRIRRFNDPLGFCTERLSMRPIAASDQALYRELYCSPKVMRHIGKPLSQIEADKAFATAMTSMAPYLSLPTTNNRYMNWTIIESASQEAIGIEGLTWHSTDRTLAEIGIMLLPKSNGKRYPEEAMGALMEYAYQRLNIHRIHAHFAAKNLATERFVKKLGFIFPPLRETANSKESRLEQDSKSCYAEFSHYLASRNSSQGTN